MTDDGTISERLGTSGGFVVFIGLLIVLVGFGLNEFKPLVKTPDTQEIINETRMANTSVKIVVWAGISLLIFGVLLLVISRWLCQACY